MSENIGIEKRYDKHLTFYIFLLTSVVVSNNKFLEFPGITKQQITMVALTRLYFAVTN